MKLNCIRRRDGKRWWGEELRVQQETKCQLKNKHCSASIKQNELEVKLIIFMYLHWKIIWEEN